MIRPIAALLSLVLIATASPPAEAESKAAVGFGSRYLQYMRVDAKGDNRRSVPMPFERLSVVETDRDRIVVLGATGKGPSRTLALWESYDLTAWTPFLPLFSTVVAAVAVDGGYAGIECTGTECSLLFYGASGSVGRAFLLPASAPMATGAQPAWHAGSKTLLFDTADGRIMEFTAERGSLRELTKGKQPRLSPDGSKLAFLRDDDIWIRDMAGGRESELTAGSQIHFWSQASDALYINRAAGFAGDGFTCTRIEVATEDDQRIWKGAPLQCEAEVIMP